MDGFPGCMEKTNTGLAKASHSFAISCVQILNHHMDHIIHKQIAPSMYDGLFIRTLETCLLLDRWMLLLGEYVVVILKLHRATK